MRFADITGHDEIIEQLRAMADNGRIPHALLFSGPQGVGKMMTARAFAQYISCSSPRNGDSCGVCPNCLQNAALQFPDLHYIFPVRKRDKNDISSDWLPEWQKMLEQHPLMEPKAWNDIIEAENAQPMIRLAEADEIHRQASLSTYSASHKIFIIWQAEKMNQETANSLLKLIEEPFGDTIFILVTNDENQILPTIFSRTRRINFRRLPDSVIAAYLTRARQLSAEQADNIARLAEGSLAAADSLALLDSETQEFRTMFRDIMRAAYGRDGRRLKELADSAAALGREKERRLLAYCSAQIRENFIYNFSEPALLRLSADEMAFSSRFAPFIHAGNVERLMQEFDSAADHIARNANAKIVSFDLMLQLMLLIRMPRQE